MQSTKNTADAIKTHDDGSVGSLIRGARLRYPILQRHLYDSRCARNVKNGVKLFNVNDYPFPCPGNVFEVSRLIP